MSSLWKKSDIDGCKKYVIAFFENEFGRRSFKLVELDHMKSISDDLELVFFSEEVPTELLSERNLNAISEKICLQDGGRFSFDAHNIWFTNEEFEDLEADRRPIRWVRGRAPMLAPR